MKLLALRLRNFKGCRQFELVANGADVNVYGDNATGKTTLHDAWTWLLFGKDSHNSAVFDIKTLDENNDPIHGLDHEVEAVLQLDDGRTVTLRKVYKEKWTKRRGAAVAEFTGHETEHYIDGVPVKKAEYDGFIADLADENVFGLLSDPTYFNEHLHWEERRALLLEVCGDVSDAEVIASNKALAALPNILGQRSIDDHRKVIAARRREINQELERIPVRIDEVDRGLPELPAADRVELEARLSDLRAKRQAQEEERVRIESGGEIAEQQKRIAELEVAMIALERRIRADVDEQLDAKQRALSDVRRQVEHLRRQVDGIRLDLQAADREIERLESRMSDLRSEWERVNAEVLQHDHIDTCPACGQNLPEDQIQEAHDRALAEFNARKAHRLEEITAEGKRLKARRDQIAEDRQMQAAYLEKVKSDLADLEKRSHEVLAEVESLEMSRPDPKEDSEYQKLADEKANAEATIAALREDKNAALSALASEIRALDDQIRSVEAALSRFEQHERGLQRIEELKAEERRLATEYERLERELYLTEEFIRTKVRMLEDRINSRFRRARFKLFRQLVNGGVEETCETLLDGVPWPSINGAGKIQVGLDIIETLGAHSGFRPPIFIDNAESVTDIPSTTAQQIRLIVSKPDKALRVETSEPKIKEAV